MRFRIAYPGTCCWTLAFPPTGEKLASHPKTDVYHIMDPAFASFRRRSSQPWIWDTSYRTQKILPSAGRRHEEGTTSDKKFPISTQSKLMEVLSRAVPNTTTHTSRASAEPPNPTHPLRNDAVESFFCFFRLLCHIS